MKKTAEIKQWCTEEEAALPFRKNVVVLEPTHPFMEIEAVKNYTKDAQHHDCIPLVVAVQEPNRESVLFSLFFLNSSSEPYVFHRYSCRGNLKKFKVVSEFSESYIREYIRTKTTADKFGI